MELGIYTFAETTPDPATLFEHELFGHDRFLLQLSVGTMPHAGLMRAIEPYGTRVAPMVRSELERRAAGSAEVASREPS